VIFSRSAHVWPVLEYCPALVIAAREHVVSKLVVE
jgi:hypothetical protein